MNLDKSGSYLVRPLILEWLLLPEQCGQFSESVLQREGRTLFSRIQILAWASFQISRFFYFDAFSQEEHNLWKPSSLFVDKLKYYLWVLRNRSLRDVLPGSFQCSWKSKTKLKSWILALNLVRKRSGASDTESMKVGFEGAAVRTNDGGLESYTGESEEACSLDGCCVFHVRSSSSDLLINYS